MRSLITETLLEMHFFRAIVEDFRKLYGPSVQFMRVLKPSTQNEAWVGFDQGWAFTKVSTSELFQQIRNAILNNTTQINNFYIGYFLQFKVVEQVITSKNSNLQGRGYGKRHFRSKLSLKPNKTTNMSQHETLIRVSNIQNATVSYACPMLFNIEDIFKEARTEDLRCINIRTAPKPNEAWYTQKQHFITFRDRLDPKPDWCSEPHEGEALSFSDWARASLKELSGKELERFLIESIHVIEEHSGVRATSQLSEDFIEIARYMPECFTIIEFQRNMLNNY